MKQTIDNSKPIFQQIKEQIEDMIMNDTISETGRVPSTNEFAKYHGFRYKKCGFHALEADVTMVKKVGHYGTC